MRAIRQGMGKFGSRRSFAALCLLLLVAAAGAAGCHGSSPPGQGDLAPDFLLRGPDGAVRNLRNYRGQTVVLNMWATWCPPCLAELPVLNAVANDFAGHGVVVIGVSGDDDPSRVTEFLKKHRVDFQVLLDPDGTVGTQYGITGYPETFLIDHDGRVRAKYIGPIPGEKGQPGKQIIADIQALIGSK